MAKKPTKMLLTATGYDKDGNIVAHHSRKFLPTVGGTLSNASAALLACGRPANCTRVSMDIELPDLS